MPNDDEGRWLGETNFPDHRTCGGRAWCGFCAEWCYEGIICPCCYAGTGQLEADYAIVKDALSNLMSWEPGTEALDRLVMHR